MAWAAGQRLYGDRYIIERPLGQGGVGITYLAKDRKGNQVVIKTLKDDVLNNPELASFRDKFQRDFRDEALRLALCRHPHIVQIDNAFQEGSLPCMAMEYVEGEDLWKWVNRWGLLSETEALRYIQQIGEALTVVHDKGLLHRDVKPHNIMLRSGKLEAVLIDFGIAREFIRDTTQAHTQALTHGFAPIEQYAEEARRGEYTDVYALAATLYYLLTGKRPTPAFARAAKVPLEAPRQINSSISDRVELAILYGMEFEPENRPASVQAWLDLFNFSSLNQDAATLPIRNVESVITTSDTTLPTTMFVSSDASHNKLSPEVGENYRQLRDLLAAGKWREADMETAAIMLKVARQDEEWLDYEHIESFPGEDLRTIDTLWVNYSNGRFGLSVQKRVYNECGKDFVTFGDRVGWRVNETWLWWNDLNFTSDALPGHLPGWRVGGSGGVWGCFVTVGESLLARPDL
ncbi:serine/threonine-protein kinase [Trichocoleus sp. ST-U3]